MPPDDIESGQPHPPVPLPPGKRMGMDEAFSVDAVSLLDHGYLQYVEHWGADERIIEAARMSTGKGFLGWEPGPCPTCAGHGHVSYRHDGGTWESGVVCSSCGGKKTVPGDKKLLARLWKSRHTTPFEFAGLVVEVQAPIMVFREWHRHRTQSYNEMSARYTPLPDLSYVPSLERLMLNQQGGNKQANRVEGAPALTAADAESFRDGLGLMAHNQQALYETALANGVPKELARSHLGVFRYSRMRACANLWNWTRFLVLRMAPDAQWEIRQYARAVGGLVRRLFPRTWELFWEGFRTSYPEVGEPE